MDSNYFQLLFLLVCKLYSPVSKHLDNVYTYLAILILIFDGVHTVPSFFDRVIYRISGLYNRVSRFLICSHSEGAGGGVGGGRGGLR